MADISQLKKKRKSTEDLKNKLQNQGQKQQESYQDDRYWYPERDKETGNASATIRFLPEPPNEDMPWVKSYRHFFKTPSGKWFVENCPTTLGRQCPVCEANSELWQTGRDENKELARSRKRQLSYVSNVYVKDDPQNPENNGTVRLLKYGQQVFNLLQSKINPEFEDEEEVNVFDPWDGADFKFRIRKVQGQVNYQSSKFEAPEALGTDEEIEEIWKQEHSLENLVDPNEFLSYDDLKKKFLEAIGNGSQSSKQDTPGHDDYGSDDGPSMNSSKSTGHDVEEDDVPDMGGVSEPDDDDDVIGEIDDLLNDDDD